MSTASKGQKTKSAVVGRGPGHRYTAEFRREALRMVDGGKSSTEVNSRTGELIGLKKKFTPRGLRRTFNDLSRQAKVEALVTRSISGHLTEQMREHYSTVSPAEQRESIGRVLQLVAPPSDGPSPEGTRDGGMHRGMHQGAGGMHERLGSR